MSTHIHVITVLLLSSSSSSSSPCLLARVFRRLSVEVYTMMSRFIFITFFVEYGQKKLNGGSGGTTLELSNDWFGADVGLAVAIINLLFLVADVACTVLLMQLFLFHIRLRQKGVTVSTTTFGVNFLLIRMSISLLIVVHCISSDLQISC